MCEGKTEFAEFIANRGSKYVNQALQVGWEMHDAEKTLRRTKMSRMEILREAYTCQCEDRCEKVWLTLAVDISKRNCLDREVFAKAVITLLEKGRGKYRNIIIKGPANCGKTFLLDPLNTVFRTFSNPATTSFAWVGAEMAEVIFLNDFRWSPQVLPWHDMLLMLEGQKVHLPAPKTHFFKDLVFEGDTPIFATGKHEIVFIRNGMLDERETEMMSVRWRVFSFSSQIPREEQRSTPACGRCFAELILG